MSHDAEAALSPEVADHVGILRRQWLTILGMIAAGLAAAALLVGVAPKTYLAAASVYVNALPGQGDTAVTGSHVTDGVNLDTEAQLLTSSVVTARVRQILGTGDSDTTLQRRVSVSVPPNSAVLDIDYRAGTSAAAAAGAGAFAQAYLANRRETAVSGQAAQVAVVKSQLEEVTAHLRDLARQLAGLPAGSTQRDLLLAQQNVLGFRVTDLADRLVTLQADNPFPGQVISPAQTASGAETPNPRLFLPAGALLGLLLGVLAAVLRDHRPRRLRRARDVERLLGTAVVADVPATDTPTSLDHYQGVANELLATLGRRPWSVLVAGVSPGCPAGRVAEEIARCLAGSGGRVALVAGDQPFLPPGDQPELSSRQESAEAPTDPPAAVHRIDTPPGVRLAEQLQTACPSGPLDELKTTFDFVVVSSAPVLSSPDAQALAPMVDAVILAVVLKHTRTATAREAIERLRRVHARLFGVVVLAPGLRTSPEGGPADQPQSAATPGQPSAQIPNQATPAAPEPVPAP